MSNWCTNRPCWATLTLLVLAPLILQIVVPGCSRGTRRKMSLRSASTNYKLALPDDLSTSNPNERLDAVIRIAESGYVDSDNAYAVLDAVARTDPQQQIRCIAVRAFTRYDDARPFSTLLTVMRATQESENALPPGNDLRWDCVAVMVELMDEGLLPEGLRDDVRDVFIDALQRDASRNVKIAAAEGLGHIQDSQVFRPLINALRLKDFAMADRAESALIQLTCVTHHYAAHAWEQRLANTAQPFAHAGETPADATVSKKPGFWSERKRGFKKAIGLGGEE